MQHGILDRLWEQDKDVSRKVSEVQIMFVVLLNSFVYQCSFLSCNKHTLVI
jgi:hypothetical protein